MNVEFIHDLLPMLLDRFYANREFTRNLFVGEAFSNQFQHFRFPRGELSGFFDSTPLGEKLPALIAQPFGNRRTEESVTPLDFMDGLQQLIGRVQDGRRQACHAIDR